MLAVNNLKQINAANNLGQAQQQLNTSFERLSSGYRINSAADDSAGLQISNRLTSSIAAGNQLVRNLSDGVSYAQIAEGGLQETAAILQRMRTLAAQAQNGIYSFTDRRSLDAEFQQLKQEVTDIAFRTEAFNRLPLVGDDEFLADTVPVLSSAFQNGVQTTMPSGLQSIAYVPANSTNVTIDIDDNGADDDIQVFLPDGTHLVGTPLSDAVWSSNGISVPADLNGTLFDTGNGYLASAVYDDANLVQSSAGTITTNGVTLSFSGDQHPTPRTESLTISSNNTPLILAVVGSGVFNVTASWTNLGPEDSLAANYSTGPVDITASAARGEGTGFINFEKTSSTGRALGLTSLSIATSEVAEAAMLQLDNALASVGQDRAYYGARINQLLSATRTNSIAGENAAAARSQIRDTDYAKETATLTSQQIVKQASVSVLSQANSTNQQALALLNTIT